MALLNEDIKKTFLQQVLGPRGGLFALGVFFGCAATYFFLQTTVIEAQKEMYEAQITQLNSRVERLETENLRINKKLEDIAFQRIND